MTAVRTLFFDAGFTLVRFARPLGVLYLETAAEVGAELAATAEHLEAVAEEIWRAHVVPWYRAHPQSSDSLEREFWRDYNRRVLAAVDGFRGDFEAWFEALYARFARPETWEPLPGARETLARLAAQGYRLGVISNWDSRLEGVLAGLGLRPFFDLVLTSAEAGFRKPHPRIFVEALRRLGAEATASLHVGDSFVDDVLGARQAGLRAVHLSPAGPRDPAVPTIRALPELPELLAGPASNSR